jgi:3-methyladenine DNA glycosylase AlkD
MKATQKLVDEIQQYCAAHADAKNAAKWERYFKEGYDAWGLLDKNHPFFNAKRDEWAERYAAIGIPGFIEAGERLFASGKYEEGSIAINFLRQRRDELDAKSVLALGRWFEAGVCNWAHTDVMCGEIFGSLLTDGRLTLDDLAPWRSSPLRFQRRAAVVAAISLLGPWKKDQAPTAAHRALTKKLLTYIRPMMLDDERVVHQGLGWFLREAWKRDPVTVEPFLLEFKDTAARLIFQYATERMSAAEKARYKAAKGAQAEKAAKSGTAKAAAPAKKTKPGRRA